MSVYVYIVCVCDGKCIIPLSFVEDWAIVVAYNFVITLNIEINQRGEKKK